MKEKLKQKFFETGNKYGWILLSRIWISSNEMRYSWRWSPNLVCYLGRLDSRVAYVVELYPYQTLTELTLLAHKVDSQQWTKGKLEFTRSKFRSNSHQKLNSTNKHVAPLKPKSPITTSFNDDSSKAPRRCFWCQGIGHIASKCPNKHIITIADFELVVMSSVLTPPKKNYWQIAKRKRQWVPMKEIDWLFGGPYRVRRILRKLYNVNRFFILVLLLHKRSVPWLLMVAAV